MQVTTINNQPYFAGYRPDPVRTQQFLNLLEKIGHGHDPDGHKVAAENFADTVNTDVILVPFLLKAFPDWKAGSQGIGDCMSWSCAHNADMLACVQAYMQGAPEEVPYQVASECMYGFMRVEVYGRPDYGGDGANGGDAAKAVMAYGVLHRTKYNFGKGYDFTTYSGSRAKSFGATGVPDELEPLAREHIVKTATLVTNFNDAAKFIMNGYPISNAASNNYTCEGNRDNEGYARGTPYSHAMNYVGVRWGAKPALLKTNTGWVNSVSGPMWPAELASDSKYASLLTCMWWEEASLCDKVLGEQDSFAYSQYQGFKKQAIPDYGTVLFL